MPPLPPLDTKSTHLSDQNDLEAPQSGRSERQSVSSRAKWLAPLLLLAALGARFLGFGVPWTGETRVKGLLERAYELLDEYPLIGRRLRSGSFDTADLLSEIVLSCSSKTVTMT